MDDAISLTVRLSSVILQLAMPSDQHLDMADPLAGTDGEGIDHHHLYVYADTTQCRQGYFLA